MIIHTNTLYYIVIHNNDNDNYYYYDNNNNNNNDEKDSKPQKILRGGRAIIRVKTTVRIVPPCSLGVSSWVWSLFRRILGYSFLCQPLPCSPAAETPILPLIRRYEGIHLTGEYTMFSSPEERLFHRHWPLDIPDECVFGYFRFEHVFMYTVVLFSLFQFVVISVVQCWLMFVYSSLSIECLKFMIGSVCVEYVCVYIYIYTHLSLSIHIYIYIYTHAPLSLYIYIYIYIHIHTTCRCLPLCI